MRKKTEEKQTNKQTVKTYPRTVGHYRKCNYAQQEYQKKKKEKKEQKSYLM